MKCAHALPALLLDGIQCNNAMDATESLSFQVFSACFDTLTDCAHPRSDSVCMHVRIDSSVSWCIHESQVCELPQLQWWVYTSSMPAQQAGRQLRVWHLIAATAFGFVVGTHCDSH